MEPRTAVAPTENYGAIDRSDRDHTFLNISVPKPVHETPQLTTAHSTISQTTILTLIGPKI
jgi:hypothetical protein